MSQLITDQEIADKKEELWSQLEETILDSVKTMFKKLFKKDYKQFLTDLERESLPVTLAKEAFKLTKEKLYDDSWKYYLNPTIFMKKIMQIFSENTGVVLRDMTRGKISVDDISRRVLNDLNVDAEIKRIKKDTENIIESTFYAENAFEATFKNKNYNDAKIILEGLKVTKGGKGDLIDIQLSNWGMDLAIATGDVVEYLALLQQSKKMIESGKVKWHGSLLENSIHNLLASAYIKGIAVAAEQQLNEKDAESINGTFYSNLVKKVSDALVYGINIPSKKEFDSMVKGAATESADTVSKFYPKKIQIIVNYKE